MSVFAKKRSIGVSPVNLKHALCKVYGYRDYFADFRLKNSGVYIEHFGVRRAKKNDGTYHLTTAPFIDRDEYLEGTGIVSETQMTGTIGPRALPPATYRTAYATASLLVADLTAS